MSIRVYGQTHIAIIVQTPGLWTIVIANTYAIDECLTSASSP